MTRLLASANGDPLAAARPLHVPTPKTAIDLDAAQRAAASSTVTSTLLGALREDPRSRQEFLALTAHRAPTVAGQA